jgi:DNA-binding Lrp family transcriptional regulator
MARRQTLDDTEKAVLEFVELRGNATVPEIARAIRIKGPRARRILDSLLERKLLYRYVHLNVYPLGYFEVDILASLKNNSPDECEKVVRWCIQHDKVSLVGEIGGAYDLKIGLTVRTMREVSEFLEAICEKFSFPFSKKRILTIIELFDFGIHKSGDYRAARAYRTGFSDSAYELTKSDHEILKLLSAAPHLTPFAIAKKLKIPPSSLNYRIEKLEDAGVIAGYRYLFDPGGTMIDFFNATVSLGGVTSESRRMMHSFCSRHPLIPFFAEVQGEVDFIVQIAAQKSRQAIEVVRALQGAMTPLRVTTEIYPSPTLRKLSKYPYE